MAASVHRRVGSDSLYGIAITIAVHGLVIFLFFGFKRIDLPLHDSTIKMLRIKPEKIESVLTVKRPSINSQSVIIIPNIPNIIFMDDAHTNRSSIQSPLDAPYELPNPADAKYRSVFDPKMRQKLLDAQKLNKPRAQEKSNSWTEADGRTFVDMGDGNCLVTMPQVDSRDSGTNWGHTRCGKNNSEKAMDRVMADYESRKIQTKK